MARRARTREIEAKGKTNVLTRPDQSDPARLTRDICLAATWDSVWERIERRPWQGRWRAKAALDELDCFTKELQCGAGYKTLVSACILDH